MIPADTLGFDEVVARSKAACEALSDDDDGLKREVLTHAGHRWSLGIVYALGVGGPMRHTEIARHLDGVTQRMLTRSLRQLERDGLIVRNDWWEKAPRVDYALTDLGRGLLAGMIPMWTRIIDNAEGIRRARRSFDRKS